MSEVEEHTSDAVEPVEPEDDLVGEVEVDAGADAALGADEPALVEFGGADAIVPDAPGGEPDDRLRPVLDVPVELVVELGRTSMTIGETLRIGRGSIVVLDREADAPADLKVNGRLIARGEVVAIDEEFGLRVTEVVSLERVLE
jgi:flagellar motor switch protein FliN/FliY